MTTIAQNFTEVIVNIFNPTMSVEPTISEMGVIFGLIASFLFIISTDSIKYLIYSLIIYSLLVIGIGILSFTVDEFIIYINTYIVFTFVGMSSIILILLLVIIIRIIIQKFKNKIKK